MYPHIEIDSHGVPILAGTSTKVIEIVLDRLSHHWDADEILRQHPHLGLSQIYAALAYYHDHQSEMDASIETQIKSVEQFRQNAGDSPVRLKLKAAGLLLS